MFYRFGECRLDPVRRVLTQGESEVSLTPKTFDLLFYLVQNPDRVVSKDELFAHLWPDSFVEERNLSQHVFLLRKALAGADGERLILTVPGRGYRLGVEVELEGAKEAAPEQVTLQAVQTSTTIVVEDSALPDLSPMPHLRRLMASRRGRWKLAGWSAAGLAVLIAAGAYAWINRPRPVLRKVVLAEFQNHTGEAVFDATLQSALRMELEQTPYILLLSPSQVNETLASMRLPRNTPLTQDVAHDLCQRANQQVVINGDISRVGTRYRISLQATNCQTGALVAGEQRTISDENNVLAAMDAMTHSLRREIGESRHQIAAFDAPLDKATTSSLEALRDYSRAVSLNTKGQGKEAIVLLEHALAIDPTFAEAWRRMGTIRLSLFQTDEAQKDYKKAFELRANTSESERMDIELAYYMGMGDYDHAIESARAAVAVYPDVERLWANLCESYRLLGRFPEAIEACEHAIRIDPSRSLIRLAFAYFGASRFADSRRATMLALSHGDKNYGLHTNLMRIAAIEGDDATFQQQLDPAFTKGNEMMFLNVQASAHAWTGHLNKALDELERSAQAAEKDGNADAAKQVRVGEAEMLVEFDRPADAIRLLGKLPGVEKTDAGAIVLAAAGDPSAARRYLAGPDAAPNQVTFHDKVSLPMLRALVAEADHKPLDGLKALDESRPYQFADGVQVPWLRARLEEQAGQTEAAIQDLRLIVANPGASRLDPLVRLAHLRLARDLRANQQMEPARAEYRTFLDCMKGADPGLQLVTAARSELAQLK